MAVAAALAVPGVATGQDLDPQKIAAAQSLYDEAVREMDAGKYAVACPKLQEVVRVIPEGMGARLALAECFEAQGKLVAAWTHYTVVAGRGTKPEHVRAAGAKAAALRPKLSSISFKVLELVAAVPGLTIRMDGMEVAKVQWTSPIPADAGSHEIVVQATGFKPRKLAVEVLPNASVAVVEVKGLEPEQVAPPTVSPPPPTVAALPTPPLPAAAPAPAPRRTSPRRVAAFAVGGVGVVGLAVGAITGAMVLSKHGSLASSCPNGVCPTPVHGDLDSYHAQSTVSTVGFIAGGVITAAGVVLFLSEPKPKSTDSSFVTPYVGFGNAGLAGRF